MNKTVAKVTSKDGTAIAYERTGSGQPVILVDGALCYRGFGPMLPLAELLAPHFTVYAYDRRGRGESGDTKPYSVDREIEDIEALIDEAGGNAHLFGTSSGGVLALKAAHKLGSKVDKLVVYEPPFVVDNQHPTMPLDYLEQINKDVADGRKGDAVARFMRVVGLPEEMIAGMENNPIWPLMKELAPSLAYDGAIVIKDEQGKPLDKADYDGINVPTLVLDGGATFPFMHAGADDIANIIPGAKRATLEGQTHEVDLNVLAPVLDDFFRD